MIGCCNGRLGAAMSYGGVVCAVALFMLACSARATVCVLDLSGVEAIQQSGTSFARVGSASIQFWRASTAGSSFTYWGYASAAGPTNIDKADMIVFNNFPGYDQLYDATQGFIDLYDRNAVYLSSVVLPLPFPAVSGSVGSVYRINFAQSKIEVSYDASPQNDQLFVKRGLFILIGVVLFGLTARWLGSFGVSL